MKNTQMHEARFNKNQQHALNIIRRKLYPVDKNAHFSNYTINLKLCNMF